MVEVEVLQNIIRIVILTIALPVAIFCFFKALQAWKSARKLERMAAALASPFTGIGANIFGVGTPHPKEITIMCLVCQASKKAKWGDVVACPHLTLGTKNYAKGQIESIGICKDCRIAVQAVSSVITSDTP